MSNFWKEFNKPIIGMAPMDGITDAAFRFMVAKYGKLARKNFDNQNLGGPDVMYTEFVPVDGICAGAEKVMDGFIFDENERPIIAQIFGGTPGNFYKVAPILCELGFDGIDINMGCPDRAIVKQGGGASLIGNPEKAKEIVAAVKGGINDWVGGKKLEEFGLAENIVEWVRSYCRSRGNGNPESLDPRLRGDDKRQAIPVSVKTRIGIDKNIIKEWARHLAEMELACVCIHGRTLKQGYEGSADWEAIAEGAKIIKESGVVVLGNGDVKDLQTTKERIEKYNVNGVLIGRAVMGAPWFFSGSEPDTKEKLKIAIEHAKYYEKIFPDRFFVNMRKHLAWYCVGFHGASDARAKLMKTNSAKECEEVILEISKNLDNCA